MLPLFVTSLSDSDAIDLFSPQRQFLERKFLSYEHRIETPISHSIFRLGSRHQHQCIQFFHQRKIGASTKPSNQISPPSSSLLPEELFPPLWCLQETKMFRPTAKRREITANSQHRPKSLCRNRPQVPVATNNPDQKTNLCPEDLNKNRILTPRAPRPPRTGEAKEPREEVGGRLRWSGGDRRKKQQQQYPPVRSERRQEILPGAAGAWALQGDMAGGTPPRIWSRIFFSKYNSV